MLIGVVIPVYNEVDMLPRLMARLEATPAPRRCRRLILLVDDASSDGSATKVREFGLRSDVLAIAHERNAGKGAAVRTGFLAALQRGVDAVIIQDADLEYDPADHDKVIAPIIDGRADVVIGSRFTTKRGIRDWNMQYLANRAITAASNLATGLDLTDIECCFKAMSRDVLERLEIHESRFGLEPELVARIAPMGVRIMETPVSFAPRTRREGKKIGWKDGVSALRCIVRYRRPDRRTWRPARVSEVSRLEAAFERASNRTA
jgi:glycosyltransferase involved in cell wall biosynthesis